MAFVWYTPTVVQRFGTPKNSDINGNFTAIQNAFNAQNSWTLVNASYAIQASGSRNVLLDLSSANSNFITITLPPSPVVGDPPVNICVQTAGTIGTADPLQSISGVVITSDGSTISGAAGAIGADGGQPYLTNPGDCMSFTFIGGSQGWSVSRFGLSAYVNPALGLVQSFTTKPSLFPGVDAYLDVSNYAASRPNIRAPFAIVGQKMSVTIRTIGTALGVSIGKSAQTFNGIAGPYNISSEGVTYHFILTGTNAFTVV